MVAGDAPSPGDAGGPGTGSRSAGTTSSGWEREPGGAIGLPFRCQASPVAAALAKQPGSLMVVSLVEDSPAPGTQSLPGAQGLPEGAGTAPWVQEPPRASSEPPRASSEPPLPPRPGPLQLGQKVPHGSCRKNIPARQHRRDRTVHRPRGTAQGRWPLCDAVHRPDRLPTGRTESAPRAQPLWGRLRSPRPRLLAEVVQCGWMRGSRSWPVALTSPRFPLAPGPAPPKPVLTGFSSSFVVSAGRRGVLWGQGDSGQASALPCPLRLPCS